MFKVGDRVTYRCKPIGTYGPRMEDGPMAGTGEVVDIYVHNPEALFAHEVDPSTIYWVVADGAEYATSVIPDQGDEISLA